MDGRTEQTLLQWRLEVKGLRFHSWDGVTRGARPHWLGMEGAERSRVRPQTRQEQASADTTSCGLLGPHLVNWPGIVSLCRWEQVPGKQVYEGRFHCQAPCCLHSLPDFSDSQFLESRRILRMRCKNEDSQASLP